MKTFNGVSIKPELNPSPHLFYLDIEFDKKSMELKDFINMHVLSGVDIFPHSSQEFHKLMREKDGYNADNFGNVIRFIIDGVTYECVEDNDDGYRSYCGQLYLSDNEVVNKFEPQVMMGKMGIENEYDNLSDILYLYDYGTNKLVLKIGTDRSDNYYPCSIIQFYPENMWINRQSPLIHGNA